MRNMEVDINKTFYALMLTLVLAALSLAQPPDVLWTTTCGGMGDDYGYSIVSTLDGGYLIVGDYDAQYSAASGDIYLIKINANGDTLWTKTRGGNSGDFALSGLQLSGGEFVINGYTHSFGAYPRSGYLMKTDSDGNELWMQTYGIYNYNACHKAHLADDGGFILAGETSMYGTNNDFLLIRTDMDGNQIWLKTYGGPYVDGADAAYPAGDGGFLVSGLTNSFGGGGYDLHLLKTDMEGDSVWAYSYGGAADDWSATSCQTSDGGLAIAGATASFGFGGDDIYLVRVNSDGDTLWTRSYGGAGNEWGLSIKELPDSGFVIAGQTNSFGNGSNDIYLLRLDANGDSLWFTTFGGEGDDWGRSVTVTEDGGYIIAGSTNSFGAGGYDVYVIRTASDSATSVISQCSNGFPKEIELLVNFSNPFNLTTGISYLLSTNSFVSLRVYDTAGRLVATLVNGWRQAGSHEVTFDGSDLAAGIYFARLQAGEYVGVEKLVLLK